MIVRRFSRFLLAMLLAAMVCLQMSGIVSFADTGYETTYTVRILPGAQGSLGGGAIVYSGLHYGDVVSFSVSSVSVSDTSKYYAKGLKDSGMDNNHPTSDFKTAEGVYYLTTDGAGNYAITVTKDQDFVVTYGLKGSSAAYTVSYVDADGNPLAESKVYYGNVGDKPVISYLYIDGYMPQAYRLTKTLQADESQNVLTFTYTKIEQPEPETTSVEPETTTAVEPETTTQPEPNTPAETVTVQETTTRAAQQETTTRAAQQETTTRAAQQETTTRAAQQETTTRAAQQETTTRAAQQETTTRAERETTTRAQQETTTRAERETTTRAQQETTPRAQQETTTRAQQETTPRAQQETTTRAERETTTRAAQQETTTRAQQETTTRAQQETTTRAQQETTTRAQQETTTRAAQQETTRAAQQETTTRAAETTSAEPLEIIDLDENVPRENINLEPETQNESSSKGFFSNPVAIGGIAAVVVIIAAVVTLIAIRKKK